LDNNEIQPSADDKDFTQKKKISGAMKIVHEARALDGGVMERAKAAGLDVLGIIESLMSSVMHQQYDQYPKKIPDSDCPGKGDPQKCRYYKVETGECYFYGDVQPPPPPHP
jgi:hypothetical protein